MATTADDRVWAYDTRTSEIEILYDGVALGPAAPLHDTDNLTVSERSGDMFVCEDADDLDVCIVTPEGVVARFAQLSGSEQSGSELTGPVFDPSGSRFFFASQRAFGLGAIYEISGPFRSRRPNLDRVGLRVSVLGKPEAATLPAAGIPIRVQLRKGVAAPPAVSARLLAGRGGGKPVELAAVERRLPAGRRRARLQLLPRKAATGVAAGTVARLVVTVRFGSGRRNRFAAPVRLD